ncbi:MAG TPA: hypothetical protein VLQ79_04120, partial [Myxococcaceae bacterium]|nr:hypothetical protein [Myxococcaceae bacterium]
MERVPGQPQPGVLQEVVHQTRVPRVARDTLETAGEHRPVREQEGENHGRSRGQRNPGDARGARPAMERRRDQWRPFRRVR